jgi:ADP-ribosylglycohydrolase
MQLPAISKLARSGSSLNGASAGETHGRTCYLNEAMPVIFHILTHAKSYTEAVRANIQCGGDSCGRAWVIGPVMATIYGIGGEKGIPLNWLTQVSNASEKMREIETLI